MYRKSLAEYARLHQRVDLRSCPSDAAEASSGCQRHSAALAQTYEDALARIDEIDEIDEFMQLYGWYCDG